MTTDPIWASATNHGRLNFDMAPIERTVPFALLRDLAKDCNDDQKPAFLEDVFATRGAGVAAAAADYLWPTAGQDRKSVV